MEKQQKNKQERIGEIIMIFDVILHAFLPVGAHYGATHIPQVQFLAMIYLISSALFAFTTYRHKEFQQLKNKKILKSICLYTALITVPYLIIFYATTYSNAINTTLLTQSEVIFATIFGYLIFREKISGSKIAGVVAILFANAVILYDGTIDLSLANLALALAPSIFVFGNMLAKKLQREGLSWSPLLLFRSVIGGIILLGIAGFKGSGLQPVDASLWPFLIFMAFFVFGIGKITWLMAVDRLDISKATALGMTYPFLSLIIAYLWLGEVPNAYQWVGVLLTAVGIGFLINTQSKQWVELD